MDRLRKALTWLLLLLWLPASLHCGLDAAELLSSHEEVAHAAHCDGVCQCEGCCVIEDGQYRPSEHDISIPPDHVSDSCCLACVALLAPAPLPRVLEPFGDPGPADLAPRWHFARRTALSPRAP